VSASDSADPDDRPRYVPDDVGTAGAPSPNPTPPTPARVALSRLRALVLEGSHWESIAERLDGI